ncbi:MAG: hypothetical protein JXR77_02595 [Lentisphaeria bacterium]|nr:hypothetical protein [Lentisphaeria bacterium]
MYTLVLSFVGAVLLGGMLILLWPGHPILAALAGMVGFLGTLVGINLALRRRVEAVFKGVQAHIESTQEQLRRRIATMQNKNMAGGKGLQKLLEKEQTDSILEAIRLLDGVAPLRKWHIMIERQANTLRGQLYYQIKDFDRARECLAKSMVPVPDPLTLAMKMALDYKDGRLQEVEKAFKRGSKRFKDEKAVLLYGLYAWVLVKSDRIDDAVAVLEEGKEKTEDETLRLNWEHLANGRVKHFSNAGLGEQWYALHLETPKPVRVRQAAFGGKIRRR